MDDGLLGTLIDSYIKLRDKKAAVKKEQDLVLKQYTDAMIQIEGFIQGHLMKQSIRSISCEVGTAFLKRERSATVADKAMFREFVISSSSFDLADFRANVDAVEDYEKERGRLPPGVNFSVVEAVHVQRK